MAAVHAQEFGAYSAPSASAALMPREVITTDNYLTAGLEGVQPVLYDEINSFTSTIGFQTKLIYTGYKKIGHYVTFHGVTQVQFVTLNGIGDKHYNWLRFLYLMDEEVFIIKIMLKAY